MVADEEIIAGSAGQRIVAVCGLQPVVATCAGQRFGEKGRSTQGLVGIRADVGTGDEIAAIHAAQSDRLIRDLRRECALLSGEGTEPARP